jgi:phosphoadenosine phosphosulfate reductase
MVPVPLPLDATAVLLHDTLRRRRYGRPAVVSSFGAESAVLLHLVAGIDPATPVIFLDTGKLFAETLRYRDTLVRAFGLRDVRSGRPDPATLAAIDPAGTLWQRDPDQCCWQRKVEPLDLALDGFDALINGRKRFHGGSRAALTPLETAPDGRTKITPLAGWTEAALIAYRDAHALPRHPLAARGYRSIGCATCTLPVRDSALAGAGDPRAGRWAGRAKTECGIHHPTAPFEPAPSLPTPSQPAGMPEQEAA